MTHDTPIRVDHIGIAVEDFDAAESVLQVLGAEKFVDDIGQDGSFRWAGYILGDASRLELVTPVRDDSFLQEYLDNHGSGVHHVTLEVADLDAVVTALEAAEVPVVDRADYDVYSEAFVSPQNATGTLFQLMQFHDAYEDRYDPSVSFVDGTRVEDAWEHHNT